MTFSEAGFLRSDEISEEIVAAVAIIQLSASRSPDNKMIFEVASQHNDDRHVEVTNILRQINLEGIEDSILIRLSALIHLSCEWAFHYRLKKKTSIVKTKFGFRLRFVYRSSSAGRELRRLVDISLKGTYLALARAIVDLSPHTFSELQRSAAEIGIKFTEPMSLLCCECVRRASLRALANLHTGRPRLREMDRAARAVKLAYQTVTGRTGSGRGTVSAASNEAGRPTGELHRLLLHVGQLYVLALVTPASDDRLRKPRPSRRRQKKLQIRY